MRKVSKSRNKLTPQRIAFDMSLALLFLIMLMLPVSFLGFFSVSPSTTQVLGQTTKVQDTAPAVVNSDIVTQSTQSTTSISNSAINQ